MIGVVVRAGLLLVAIAPSAIAQQRDTTTYANAATAELVALARLRHQRTVGAHFVGKLLIQRGAADHYFDLVTHPGILEGLDSSPHVGHGRGQQGRHTQHLSFVLHHRVYKLLCWRAPRLAPGCG